jgi:hypothetical protein
MRSIEESDICTDPTIVLNDNTNTSGSLMSDWYFDVVEVMGFSMKRDVLPHNDILANSDPSSSAYKAEGVKAGIRADFYAYADVG